jgi:hypothetical protein
MTYFTELLWANVISYMGSLKEVEYHLTSGVYVLPSAVPSGQYISLNKYKITNRVGNYVWLSAYSHGAWGPETLEKIQICDGYEYISGSPERLFQSIYPTNKMNTMFTEKDWKRMNLVERLERYNETNTICDELEHYMERIDTLD